MLEIYKTEEFARWFKKLKDRNAKARIQARIDRMELGHFGDVEPDLRRRMASIFPLLKDAETKVVWSGKIGITVNRIPHFGRTQDDIYFVQGFSGHGVALSGQAGVMLADAIIGDQTRFDIMSSLKHMPFPGGPFRTPALALGMAWYKLRDRLKI